MAGCLCVCVVVLARICIFHTRTVVPCWLCSQICHVLGKEIASNENSIFPTLYTLSMYTINVLQNTQTNTYEWDRPIATTECHAIRNDILVLCEMYMYLTLPLCVCVYFPSIISHPSDGRVCVCVCERVLCEQTYTQTGEHNVDIAPKGTTVGKAFSHVVRFSYFIKYVRTICVHVQCMRKRISIGKNTNQCFIPSRLTVCSGCCVDSMCLLIFILFREI